MLLTLTTTRPPATDLGFLLHKHPDRFQSFALGFGAAHVFYPEAAADRCSACLLLDVDPVGIVRGKGADPGFALGQYVNDRPYTASSFLSVAIGRVFGSALRGQCPARPGLADERLPLTAAVDVLPVRGGDGLLRAAFEPLGYRVEAVRHPLDETFPDWGDSPYYSVAVSADVRLADLLSHLYVLVPALAGRKHYFVGDDEVDKLVDRGGRWLPGHPLRDEIARRYLHHRPDLVADAAARLAGDDLPPEDEGDVDDPEAPLRLNDVRLRAVAAALKATGGRRVVDLGCGEGGLIRELLADPQFERIVGVDVSPRCLAIAARRLGLDRLPPGRVELWQGSLVYRDGRLEGFDAAACVEVVEHVDPARRPAFERAVFGLARPRAVVLTTPNREYNAVWPRLPAGRPRHPDHRFEWDRAEFRGWADGVAVRFGYAVRFAPVGPEHPEYGPPTQMAVFDRTA